MSVPDCCLPDMEALVYAAGLSYKGARQPLLQAHLDQQPLLAMRYLKKHCSTKKVVPKGAKRMWAQCFLSALCSVVAYNDTQSWQELYALPKCALRGQQRGGAARNSGEAETERLCQGWLEGQRMSLWHQVKESKYKHQWVALENVKDATRSRVCELAGLNQFRKACCALIQAPPVQVTSQVVSEMQTKHPRARATLRWDQLRPVHAAASVMVDFEAVSRAIKSFPRGSGCGPCGLRPQHLRDALVPGFEDEVLRQLTAVVNLLARGEAPDEVRSFLSGATLAALPKEDGDLRPIAVGEVLRRLVGKCCAENVKEDTREILALGKGEWERLEDAKLSFMQFVIGSFPIIVARIEFWQESTCQTRSTRWTCKKS